MKGVIALPLAAALIIVLTACGEGRTPRPAATVTVTASPHTTLASSAAAKSVPTATNERLFADGMSAAIPAIPAWAISGALMRAYARFEHAEGGAFAAVGQPGSGTSVTQISDGFKQCGTDSSGGSNCVTFTQLATNHAGRLTGVSVNGQPVAGRIATAPSATSGGLTISGVVAYRLTEVHNEVDVAFKLADTSYRPVNTSPALIASLGGASDDMNGDALPATLAPGDTLYAMAAFDITQVTGLFCLQPNDGFGEHLPCTTLSKV